MCELQHTVKSAVSMWRPCGLSLRAALACNRAENLIDAHSKNHQLAEGASLILPFGLPQIILEKDPN